MSSTRGIVKIFNYLKKDRVECSIQYNEYSSNKFIPPLTISKFKLSQISSYKNSLQMNWNAIKFKCDRLYLISRKGFEPFKIRYQIKLS